MTFSNTVPMMSLLSKRVSAFRNEYIYPTLYIPVVALHTRRLEVPIVVWLL